MAEDQVEDYPEDYPGGYEAKGEPYVASFASYPLPPMAIADVAGLTTCLDAIVQHMECQKLFNEARRNDIRRITSELMWTRIVLVMLVVLSLAALSR